MNAQTRTQSSVSPSLACPTCGSALHAGANFCGICGAQTEAAASRGPLTAPPSRARGHSTLPVPVSADAPIHPMAVASLGLGVAAFGPVPILGSVGALITARIARRSFREEPGRYRGHGLAKAGMILGIVQLGLIGLAITAGLAILAFFALLR